MSLVRAALTLALVAPAACVNHAKQLAKSATMGIKAQVAQIDPGVARIVGDEVARGAVSGAIAELESAPHREVLGAQLQELVDRTVAYAVGGVGRQLATDRQLQDQLGALAHQVSASAVYGARDALGEIFPECTGAADRRRCVEAEVGALSRAAARGMMGGVADVVRWPILALVFLAGIAVTLLGLAALRAAARTRAPERHRSPRA